MDIEEKVKLVQRPPTVEVVTVEELKELFETCTHPRHYIGFEISGLAHLGTALMTAFKVKDFLAAGCKCMIFLADIHSWINKKLGEDLEAIKRIACSYFIHAFKSCGLEPGSNLEYILASEVYDNDYWIKVISVAKRMTLSRAKRTLTIMGREHSESLDLASYIYTPMQVADIFHLNVDIAHSGMDQRKAHMLAREVAPKLGYRKPIAVHHHLLMGLKSTRKAGYEMSIADLKMSKSVPESCVFIHDSPEEIRRKVRGAYCPPRDAENNPVMDIIHYIVFHEFKVFHIDRPAKYGGPVEFESFEELKQAYEKGEIHPLDLKNALAEHLIKILEPCRRYFENKMDLVEEVKSLMTGKVE